MMYFSNITSADLVTFEGRTVSKITPVHDKKSKERTHYRLSVVNDDGNVELRKFRVEEIPHLIDNELLVVDKGYHSLTRQTDRALYGRQELYGATKAQRERVDLILFCNGMMLKYQSLGMKRTRKGVDEFRPLMESEYRKYQARKSYGTEKPNAAQYLKPLPSSDTLLVNSRKIVAANGNPNVYLVPRAEPIDMELQAASDFCFIMQMLGKYACGTCPAKVDVIRELIEDLEFINEDRKAAHNPSLIKIMCQKTYERWIDKYLDPFLVVLQRKGLAAAQKKFGTVEEGRTADILGEIAQADAWKFHIVSLDTTRERYNQMTEEERLKVKRVRRWVVVILDVASRAILGFSICRAPNEQASLEALRMVFMDKTYLFRDAGVLKSDWDYVCPIQEMVNDCGSEFGKHPFGGALFAQGVRTLGATLMNTAAGVSMLRGHIERFFWTLDLKYMRHLPGYTANNPQSRNDRKPSAEACITDDELHTLFVQFIAEYHKTEHRGLNFRTPAAVWKEKCEMQEFDITMMPSPSQLREACGFYSKATVCEAGIKFGGAIYANEFTRRQRTGPVVERLVAPGKSVEIKIDPFDLGSISVVAKGELISVPCRDRGMNGKTLRQWQNEKQLIKLTAKVEALEQKGARDEARRLWQSLSRDIARSADVGLFGYSQSQIDRIMREENFGKGDQDERYIGLDEYQDPMSTGFEISNDDFDDGDDLQEEVTPDTPTSMDRFRSKSKSRKQNKNRELDQ